MDAVRQIQMKRTPDVSWLVVPAIPLLLLVFGSPSLFHDPPGWLDPYCYVGYFRHYHEQHPHLANYYKASRLPWIYPGWVCHQVLGSNLGNMVLHVGTMLFVLGCLFALLRRAFDSATAVVGVCILGSCVNFHGLGGWNYHMIVTIGYFLGAALSLERALGAARRQYLWYALSGASFACAVHTHLFAVTLGPGLFVHYLLRCHSKERLPSWKEILAVLVGAGGITTVLGLISKASGGALRFWVLQIEFTRWLAREGNQWHRPLSLWGPVATWLILPVAALFGAGITFRRLWQNRTVEREQTFRVLGFQMQALLAVGFAAYFQFVKKQTILDHSYSSGVLLGPAMLGLAAFIASVGGACWRKGRLSTATLALALLPGMLLCVGAIRSGTPTVVGEPSLVLPMLLAIGSVFMLRIWGRNWVGLACALAMLGGANCLSSKEIRLYTVSGPRQNRDLYHFFIESDEYFGRLDPSLKDIRFWVRADDTYRTRDWVVPIHDSFMSFLFVQFRGQDPVPPVEKLSHDFLKDASRFAVLSRAESHTRDVQELMGRLQELGYALSQEDSREFHHGDLHLATTIWKLSRRTAVPSTQ